MNLKNSITAFCAILMLSFSSALADPVLTTLATFTGPNGSFPSGGVIFDASGNLYGTTQNGGIGNNSTIFKVSANTHILSTVASFNGNNGAAAYAGLVADAAGNMYGTTVAGGASQDGTVFKIAAGSNTITRLASFNGSNGADAYTGVIVDASGNLYGTTDAGGPNNDGTVFKVAAGGNTITTLATFNGTNGKNPFSSLVADASGNLYGTTQLGGLNDDGTVFKIAAGTNALTTLVTFNGLNGRDPYAGLIADASGNLYGTTQLGGSNLAGTVFKIDAGTNAFTTLAEFGAGNGQGPLSLLLEDASGNLYGTNEFGVFKVAVGSNTITTLASFGNLPGSFPFTPSGLVADVSGNLYGTTESNGPSGKGVVFELSGTGFVVPEPTSLSLLALAFPALLVRQKRKRV